MERTIEVRKVDSQGRIVLPLDWRENDLKESQEVIIIKEKGFLKIIPKKKTDLTRFFDSLDFGDDILESSTDWNQVEKRFAKKILKENDE